MDFRAQRYRDRLRAEGRSVAIRTARRTRDILDGYVKSRRGTEPTDPIIEVRWGRVLVVFSALVVGLYLLTHGVR